MFAPYIEQGEIANLPAFNYYVRIAAIQAQEPLSGITILLSDPTEQSEKIRKHIISNSRKMYAIKYKPATTKETTPPKETKPKKGKLAQNTRTDSSQEERRKLPGEQ